MIDVMLPGEAGKHPVAAYPDECSTSTHPVAAYPDECWYCGCCVMECPTGAITFEEREAPTYNEAAVQVAKQAKDAKKLPCGCPGTAAKAIHHEETWWTIPRN